MLPPVKKSISCCLSHQNPATYCLELFWTVLACKHCLICADFSPQTRWYSLRTALLWIKDLYFSLKQWLKVKKHVNDGFVSYKHSICLLKMLTDGLEWCGLFVDYCDVFISCLDSHSDGTHSLQRIHFWVSDAKLHFSRSDELIPILDGFNGLNFENKR